MCNLYCTILYSCTVQVRSDEVLLLQLQVSVRTPISRQHRHRAAWSSGALVPSQVVQPSPRWATCRIGSYRKSILWKAAKLKLLTKSNLNSKTLLIKVQRDFLFYTKWQVAELQSQAALFEVPVPDYPLIKQCRFFIDDHDDKMMTTMMLMDFLADQTMQNSFMIIILPTGNRLR